MREIILKQNEMQIITGGGITSSWLNSITKIVGTIYDLGEKTGSSIRRLITKSYCKAR